MRLAGQGYRRKHFATLGFDIALQIRQRAAHADEIIDQHVFATALHRASKFRLARQSRKSVSSGVCHHVNLRHAQVMRPTDGLADLHRKRFGNSVYAFALIRMSAHQRGRVTSQQINEPLVLLLTHRVVDQRSRRGAMPRLGPFVSRMLLYRRLTGVDQHIGEVSPRGARRFDGC